MKTLKFSVLALFSLLLLLAVGCTSDLEDKAVTSKMGTGEIETRQQWFEGDWWGVCEAANLIIFVNPCFFDPARVEALQGINDAIDAFNNAEGVGIGMTLVFDATNPDIDVTIDCDDMKIESLGFNGCANALGGDFVSIDTNGPGGVGCPVNTCFHTNTIMHELGHILGFGHTNDVTEGITIAGTVVNNNSVLVEGDCNSTICEFSAGDILALQTQYPCECSPAVDITGPTILCALGEELTYCISEEFTAVGWDIPSKMTLLGPPGNCVTVSLNSFEGHDPIGATLEVNGCLYDYELAIATLAEPTFDIEFNGPVCVGDIVRFTILGMPAGQDLTVVDWEVKFGGLNIMNPKGTFALAEASSPGVSRICATVANECGNERKQCVNVDISSNSQCSGDGDITNPK